MEDIEQGKPNLHPGSKKLKLSACAFKTLDHWSRPYGIFHMHEKSVLEYHHQKNLEKMKIDDLEVPKVDKNSLEKLEAIVLHLNLTLG